MSRITIGFEEEEQVDLVSTKEAIQAFEDNVR